MAPFADNKLSEIRDRADIAEIIGAHIRLKRAGRNLLGLCPFHTEKTPSFSVRPDRGYFHCFGCGASGSVFDFVMKVEGLNFPEAVRSLARRYGIALPEYSGGPEGGDKARDAMFQAAETARAFFEHVLWNLPEGGPAREYLKRRGIPEQCARDFSLGFAPMRESALANALAKRSILDAGIKVGLVRTGSGAAVDMFRGRLMFPIRDVHGRVRAFGGRVLDDRLPKYINSSESPLYSKSRSVYGLFEARRAIAAEDRVIVVEGYIDTIALSQAGFRETVASLGTSLTVDQLRVLARSTRNVHACFDGDEAGHKASLRALEVFLTAGLLAKAVFIPSGFDPDTFIRDRGADAFRELLAGSELLVDYFLKSQSRMAGGTMQGKARAAENVAAMLRMVTNPFEFDLLARKAAEELGVREEVLRQQASQQRKVAPTTKVAPKPASIRGPEDQIGLIVIALQFPELRAEILGAAQNFRDPRLCELLVEACESDRDFGELAPVVEAKLTEAERTMMGELIVGARLDDSSMAQSLAADYMRSLARANQRTEVERLRRVAVADGAIEDQTAAAQKIISLRRDRAGSQ